MDYKSDEMISNPSGTYSTSKRSNLTRRLWQNPVVLKELRGRMRGGRTFILITIYLAILGGILSMIMFIFAAANQSPGSIGLIHNLGKTIFGAVFGLEMTMICFVAPALTAGAISAEREHQTFDLLRTSLLSARSLVIGKLFSTLSFLLLLLVVAFPLHSIAFLFGGVTIEELLIAFLLLVVTAIIFSSIGLFVSSFTRKTLVSTVVSYIAVNLIVFGLPIFIYISLAFSSSFLGDSSVNLTSAQRTFLEIILVTVGWFFVAFNPIAAAIASEIILIENQSTLLWNLPLSNGTSLPIISPWIGYVVLSLMISAVLVCFSIRFVRRTDK